MRLSPVTNAEGRRGQHVEIPLTLGPKKEAKDEEGAIFLVFDFVVAPATLEAALSNPGMMKTLAETVRAEMFA